ncbi:MAG: hypothetical protein IIT90_07890 [Clostridiales bacterium]|nr:hypothetical protein [Clostridiales bacterium]
MKKLIALIMVCAMSLAVFACGKKAPATESSKDNKAAQTDDKNGGETTKAPSADALVLLPGKLVIVNEGDNGPVIKGVNVAGNICGTTEFNSKAPAADGVRCVFELNEYLDFYLDTNETSGLKVFAYKHAEDANIYIDRTNGEDGAAGFCDLNKPEDAADSWGAFYVNPADWQPGYYDLVFTKDGKAVALMQIKYFNDGEIQGKSDEELTALMKSF